MQIQTRTRGGFTFIEILVVIAIITVLVALLLPAVNAVREAARRMQCVNNLMQLSTAVKQYETAHGLLPPGVVNPTGPILNRPKGYHQSWLVQLLPAIEQVNVYNTLNFANGVYDPENHTGRTVLINTLLCPSDPPYPRLADGLADNNYAGCHNDFEALISASDKGVFFLNSKIRYEDIPDGTSSTIFIGEKIRSGTELGWASGTRATLRNAGFGISAPSGRPGSSLPAIDEEPIYLHQKGDHIVTAETEVGSFGSKHSGGANYAFGDGSVRFLKTSMTPSLFRLLANRADGEMISGDQY